MKAGGVEDGVGCTSMGGSFLAFRLWFPHPIMKFAGTELRGSLG